MKIEESALLPYSAAQIFTLINDVERYPQFLDGCEGAEIFDQQADSMHARLDISSKGVSFSLETRNAWCEPKWLEMNLVSSGPLKSLHGLWTIKPLGNLGCKVNLKMDFIMKSSLTVSIAAKVVAQASQSLIDAMATEAHKRFK